MTWKVERVHQSLHQLIKTFLAETIHGDKEMQGFKYLVAFSSSTGSMSPLQNKTKPQILPISLSKITEQSYNLWKTYKNYM